MSLQEFGEKWLDVDGIRTRYFEAGEGRTIVLVHGGTKGDASGGANAEDFHLNFAELAKNFRVISVDRLGQGYTDNPKRDEDYTMAASVRHFAGFLKALGGGPFNLVGHSRGGYVVGAHDARLSATCGKLRPHRFQHGFARARTQRACLRAQSAQARARSKSSRWVYEKYSCTTQHVTDAWIALKQKITEHPKNKIAIAKMKDEGLLATRFLPELLEDKDEFFAKLENVGMQRPIMLFWGFNDPTAPLTDGMDLYDLIARKQPRTSLHVVNQAGHHSFRERAAEFNRVVAEFVEGVAHGE